MDRERGRGDRREEGDKIRGGGRGRWEEVEEEKIEEEKGNANLEKSWTLFALSVKVQADLRLQAYFVSQSNRYEQSDSSRNLGLPMPTNTSGEKICV